MNSPKSVISGGIREWISHDSAGKHVSGEALYVDDMPEPPGLLHLYPFISPHAHARIVNVDVSDVLASPGVVTVIDASDIDGTNDFGLFGLGDDRVCSDSLVEYAGQIIFAVAAETRAQARDAIEKAHVELEILDHILTVDEAIKADSKLFEPRVLERGNQAAAIDSASHRLSGRTSNGGQEHFYLETQVSVAIPREDGDVLLFSATQDPTAVQSVVARVLGKPFNNVMIEVRRIGGAFGGKEAQATHYAALAAIACLKTDRPAKMRLDRDDDMKITGKRHVFHFDYNVGFDDSGRIEGIEFDIHGHCGSSADQSEAVIERAVLHIDNCYFLENVKATFHFWKTHTVSSVSFRGFGSPQGMLAIERVLDRIARYLNLDPLEVREINFYDDDQRATTPSDAPLIENILPRLVPELIESSDYHARRKEIEAFNRQSPILKKGIAFTPIKYGIGYEIDFLNQGGALLNVYTDGSVQLNHGGIEMGQGLLVKVGQVVAEEFQIDIAHIRVSATTTEKVPNTIATAASSGTDVNAAAAQNAARKIKKRLIQFLAEAHNVSIDQVEFLPNRVRVGNQEIPFPKVAEQAHMASVSLSATGFYKAPKNNFNPKTMKGQPNRYYAYGAAVAEVLIDTLTGENKISRVDILHDVGKSLNPAIDYGQLEGGFIQGAGWLTTEELVWDLNGVLKTHAPSTYKIPVVSDRPDDFRMKFIDWGNNVDDSVFRSKAIGEPPFCLAICVLSAFSDAVASVMPKGDFKGLDAPATPENILLTIHNANQS